MWQHPTLRKSRRVGHPAITLRARLTVNQNPRLSRASQDCLTVNLGRTLVACGVDESQGAQELPAPQSTLFQPCGADRGYPPTGGPPDAARHHAQVASN